MADKVNGASNPDKSDSKPIIDKVTKNKIDKHLKDIDDTISEQDIRNIKTGNTSAYEPIIINKDDN